MKFVVLGVCNKCGKPLLQGHICNAQNQSEDYTPVPPISMREHSAAPVGWICPKCGRGNSPFTNTCPCIPMKYDITC